ncbi:MAG: nuclear transport factor 2 family protein [Ignavibacteriae bacterium]|nr:nuclear transport factor 2 family protein [Ignavibacteriota bacterium]
MKNEQMLSVVKSFISHINSVFVDGIVSLMSDDHTFIDSHGNRYDGKEKMKTGWLGYFALFPDYKIEVEQMFENGNTVSIFGYASGTFRGMSDNPDAHWRLPASWKAIVEDGKIKLWQVYADVKIPFDIMQKYSEGKEDENAIQGLGGVFFKSKDPKALTTWYDEHLGTHFGENTWNTFKWREREHPSKIGRTEFSVFKETTTYFQPSEKQFMFNFRVKNLDAMLAKLKAEGVHVEEKTEVYDYGKFGWIVDLEGNKIELWEPVDEVLEEFNKKQ